MPGDWKETPLAALIDLKHGFAFSGENIRDAPPGDILLTPGNFAIGGGFKGDKFKYFDGAVPEDYVLNEGDLLVTMTDLSKQADTLGYPALVPKPGGARFLHNQRLGKVLIKSDAELAGGFLYYLLRTAEYRHEVMASATGTTVKHTSPGRILAHKVALPPFTEQKAIAHILGTLDDKIELNRRMNEMLEMVARTLFKSWFVNFDPVRAKAEGRETGLPKHIVDLFPDTVEDSELGDIPKGWELQRFTDTVDIIGGGTPKTSVAEYWDGDIPWFSVVDAPRNSDVWVVDTVKKITREGVENSSTRILSVGTTIISARGTVGRIALVAVPMAMNQSCYGLRGKVGTHGFFTYFSTQELVTRLQQHAHGSVFDTITQDTLAGVSLASPPVALIEAFETSVKPTLERIRVNLLSSHTLAALRDALLPRLISGELRLKVAERFLEGT